MKIFHYNKELYAIEDSAIPPYPSANFQDELLNSQIVAWLTSLQNILKAQAIKISNAKFVIDTFEIGTGMIGGTEVCVFFGDILTMKEYDLIDLDPNWDVAIEFVSAVKPVENAFGDQFRFGTIYQKVQPDDSTKSKYFTISASAFLSIPAIKALEIGAGNQIDRLTRIDIMAKVWHLIEAEYRCEIVQFFPGNPHSEAFVLARSGPKV